MTQSLFDIQETPSQSKLWKIIHMADATTGRIEKYDTDGKKEFEILLSKEEIRDLLTLEFNQ